MLEALGPHVRSVVTWTESGRAILPVYDVVPRGAKHEMTRELLFPF